MAPAEALCWEATNLMCSEDFTLVVSTPTFVNLLNYRIVMGNVKALDKSGFSGFESTNSFLLVTFCSQLNSAKSNSIRNLCFH